MVEARIGQEAPDNKINQIYKKIEMLVKEHGVDVPGGGKSVAAELNFDTSNCITVSLFSGRVEGEVKAIYKNERVSGSIERIEYSFRQGGGFEKRVLRNIQTRRDKPIGQQSLEEVYRIKRANEPELSDIEKLLSGVMFKLENPDINSQCTDKDTSSTPKHKHLISIKKKQNK